VGELQRGVGPEFVWWRGGFQNTNGFPGRARAADQTARGPRPGLAWGGGGRAGQRRGEVFANLDFGILRGAYPGGGGTINEAGGACPGGKSASGAA